MQRPVDLVAHLPLLLRPEELPNVLARRPVAAGGDLGFDPLRKVWGNELFMEARMVRPYPSTAACVNLWVVSQFRRLRLSG